MRSLISGVLLVLTALTAPAWAQSPRGHCIRSELAALDATESSPEVRKLARLIDRISPSEEVRLVTVDSPIPPVHRLSESERGIFKPEYKGQNTDGHSLHFSVVSSQEFETASKELAGKGFWIIFTPSGEEARVATGHFTVAPGSTLFNRNVDEPGANALASIPMSELFKSPEMKHITENQYVMAQFFEVSDGSVKSLEKFYNDRTWFYHSNSPEYASRYVPLPFTRDKTVPNGENCVSFVYAWYNDRWVQKRPELLQIAKEVGSMPLAEIPSKQVFLNPQSQAYRGTLLITEHPKSNVDKSLRLDAFVSHPSGVQLLFRAPLK